MAITPKREVSLVMSMPIDPSKPWRLLVLDYLIQNPKFYMSQEWENLFGSHPGVLHPLRGMALHYLTLKFLVERFAKKKEFLDPLAFASLLLGFYQILYMPEIPLYAAIYETVEAGKRGKNKRGSFLNAIFRKLTGEMRILPILEAAPIPHSHILPLSKDRYAQFSKPIFPDPQKDRVAYVSFAYSFPKNLVQQILSTYGPQKTETILQESNEGPPLFARIRKDGKNPETWRNWEKEAKKYFPKAKISPTPHPEFIQLQGISLAKWPPFQKGQVYLQDINSGRVLEQLLSFPKNFQPSRILDLCCAPGGKLCHLYDLFPQAEIFGVDKSRNRLEKTKENLKRLHIPNITLIEEDCRFLDRNQLGEFDLILLDAPCSNTGVLRRKVQARWKWDDQRRKTLLKLQKELLQKNLSLLSPKGLLLYITCSILKEENHPEETLLPLGWKKVKEVSFLPGEWEGDGFWGTAFEKQKG